MHTATLSAEREKNGRGNPASVPAIPRVTENRADQVELNGETGLPPARKNRRRVLKRAAVAALIMFAGLGAAKLAHNWWTVGRYIESTDDAYVSGEVTVIAPRWRVSFRRLRLAIISR